MSVESVPSGMGQSISIGSSGGPAHTAERAPAPGSSMAKSTGGRHSDESIAHITLLNISKSSFSPDTHQSFHTSEFRTIASAKPETPKSTRNSPSERQTLEQLFKTSTPLKVSRTPHSIDTVQPFPAHELKTMWKTPSVEHQKTSAHTNQLPEPKQHPSQLKSSSDIFRFTEPYLPSHEFLSPDTTKPLQRNETVVLWKANPSEKQTEAKPSTKAKMANEHSVPSHPDSRAHFSNSRTNESKHNIQQEIEAQKSVKTSQIEVNSPLLEHQEVKTVLQKTHPQEQKQVVIVQPKHNGSKIELDTKTTELLKAYKLSEQQQTKSVIKEQARPKVEFERVISLQPRASIKPEATGQVKVTSQEIDAVVNTFIQAAKVSELMEQTGLQPETAQSRVLGIVQEIVKKQNLQTATKEIIKQEIPGEKKEELQQNYFNRDIKTDAVRATLAVKAAIETQDKQGKVDGAKLVEKLPDSNVDTVKSELVKGTTIADGSMEEIKNEISHTQTKSLSKMKEKIDEAIEAKPAVTLPDEIEKDPVTSQDVQRVYGEQQIA